MGPLRRADPIASVGQRQVDGGLPQLARQEVGELPNPLARFDARPPEGCLLAPPGRPMPWVRSVAQGPPTSQARLVARGRPNEPARDLLPGGRVLPGQAVVRRLLQPEQDLLLGQKEVRRLLEPAEDLVPVRRLPVLARALRPSGVQLAEEYFEPRPALEPAPVRAGFRRAAPAYEPHPVQGPVQRAALRPWCQRGVRRFPHLP